MNCSRHSNTPHEERGNTAVDRVHRDVPLASTTLADWRHRRGCADCRQAHSAELRAQNGLAQMQTETLSAVGLNRMLAALGLPDLPTLTPQERARMKAELRGLLLLIGLIVFVTTLAQPDVIAPLAVERFWFGDQSANALQTALLWLLLGAFWYAKPIFAFCLQSKSPPAPSRRQWLTGSALCAASLWLAASVTHSATLLVCLLVAIGAMLALASTVMGGILVEQGQRMGATGRLGALHAGGVFLARLAGAGAASLLGLKTLHFTAPFCALILTGFALLCWTLLREDRKGAKEKEGTGNREQGTGETQSAIHNRQSKIENRKSKIENRNTWGVIAIACLVYMAPNFTALQDQENVRLHFGEGMKYGLAFVGGACGLAGVGGYLYLCRRVALQTLLMAGIGCNALGTLLYLGYRTPFTAVCIEGANGVLSALVFAMLFDLAIRAIPRGQAMLGYALLTSVFTFASRLSNVFGSWLNINAHWNFGQVVGLSAFMSLPALAVVAYLPASLLDRREGKIVTEGAGETLAGAGVPVFGR